MAKCVQCFKRCARELACAFCGRRPLCLRCVCVKCFKVKETHANG